MLRSMPQARFVQCAITEASCGNGADANVCDRHGNYSETPLSSRVPGRDKHHDAQPQGSIDWPIASLIRCGKVTGAIGVLYCNRT